MMLRLRFRSDTVSPVASEPLLFAGLDPGRAPKAGSIVGSLFCHVAALSLAAVIGHYVAVLHEDDVDWSQYHAEPLRLHVSQPLFFNSRAAGEAPRAEPAPAPPRKLDLLASAETAAAPQDAPAPRPLPRRLELPAPRQPAVNAPILLQPDIQPQLKPPPATLPPLAFWARQQQAPPKPPPRNEIVVPGRTESPSAAPQLSAPPVLAVPNREQQVANVNIAVPPVPRDTPAALPAANSTTMPVRLRDATESRAASFDPAAGQPVNVLSLAGERPDVREVTIPRGLQNIPRTDSVAGAASDGVPRPPRAETGSGSASSPAETKGAPAATTGTGAASGAPSTSNSASGSSVTPATAASSSASGSNPAPPSRAPATGAGRGGIGPAGDAAKDSDPAKSLSASAPATPPRGGVPPGVTKIDHPVNGKFDVVVTQSAPRSDFAEIGAVLTGNPVYSVYLAVGDRKEWLLEYCVPARQQARANPYQIDVDDVGAITPPYPISTVIPNSVLAQPIPRHIILHGFLTATGTLKNVAAPDNTNPLMTEILALLSQWQFRPALRNAKPIDVEILLVIPRHG